MVLPLRIRDISPSMNSWPVHLIELISGSSTEDQGKMHIEEFAACLCHVALVEIGFVPTFLEIQPESIPEMKETDRISMSKQIPPRLRNSVSGVMTISYRGIQEKLVENPSEPETKQKIEYSFNFTNPADVIMIFQNSVLSVYGTVKRDHLVPASLNLQLRVQDFLRIKVSHPTPSANKIFCEERSGGDWLDLVELRGAALSDMIKKNFGFQLLNLVDGISFEPGLTDISPEVLFRVFKYLDIRTILFLTESCWYFYEVIENNYFWLTLIDRDFPKQAKEIRTNLTNAEQSQNQTNAVVHPADIPSAYTEYRRLYINALGLRTRYRRLGSFGLIPRQLHAPRSHRSMVLFR